MRLSPKSAVQAPHQPQCASFFPLNQLGVPDVFFIRMYGIVWDLIRIISARQMYRVLRLTGTSKRPTSPRNSSKTRSAHSRRRGAASERDTIWKTVGCQKRRTPRNSNPNRTVLLYRTDTTVPYCRTVLRPVQHATGPNTIRYGRGVRRPTWATEWLTSTNPLKCLPLLE